MAECGGGNAVDILSAEDWFVASTRACSGGIGDCHEGLEDSRNALLQGAAAGSNEDIERGQFELAGIEGYRFSSETVNVNRNRPINRWNVQQVLAEKEGQKSVQVMISLLTLWHFFWDRKNNAAECLQNLSSGNDDLKRHIISEGGVQSLLVYLDGPLPQESAVGALKILVSSISLEVLISLGVLPRLVHVLKSGSPGAQQASATAICRICTSAATKKTVGEAGCIPLLVKMLEAKANSTREVAAQALYTLMTLSYNCREVKKDDRSGAKFGGSFARSKSLKTAPKKYAVSCLTLLTSSRNCKRLMVFVWSYRLSQEAQPRWMFGSQYATRAFGRGKLRIGGLRLIRWLSGLAPGDSEQPNLPSFTSPASWKRRKISRVRWSTRSTPTAERHPTTVPIANGRSLNGEQLDVEAYASLYSGRTKIVRLLFIADRCDNVSMQLEALRMAYEEIKKGENTQLFREAVQKDLWTFGANYEDGFCVGVCSGPPGRAEEGEARE
nr:protein CELLULOSE SYNTHASE INTERACTIVE 3 [Ipomoea batatas]